MASQISGLIKAPWIDVYLHLHVPLFDSFFWFPRENMTQHSTSCHEFHVKVFPMRMAQPPWTSPRIRTLSARRHAESKSRSLGRLVVRFFVKQILCRRGLTY